MNDNEIANAYLESLTADLDAAGLSPVQERPPGFGITIKEYMELERCNEAPARNALENAVKAGVFVSHRMRQGAGGHPLVFCRPSEWPPK